MPSVCRWLVDYEKKEERNKVEAARIIIPLLLDKNIRPKVAKNAETANNPKGDNLCTIGPEYSRSIAIMVDVYINNHNES